jgi:hypothetical protein
MTFQFNNLQDEDHLEMDQLRTDHNISKILSFTDLSGKRGAVASLDRGATTKSKSSVTGGTANNSSYHHQSFRQPCSIPLKSKLLQGRLN